MRSSPDQPALIAPAKRGRKSYRLKKTTFRYNSITVGPTTRQQQQTSNIESIFALLQPKQPLVEIGASTPAPQRGYNILKGGFNQKDNVLGDLRRMKKTIKKKLRT